MSAMQAVFKVRSQATLKGFLAVLLLAALAAVPVQATQPAQHDGLGLLERLQRAAHELDYAGVFIYQHGQTVLSSQIVHVVDDRGERQRIEILDGRTEREFLRRNNEVHSLFPELRTVLVERRESDHFPGLFAGPAGRLAAHYAIEIEAEPGRVAGRPCHVVHVVPRDALRWGYQLCVDQQFGLLLKVQTVDGDGDVLEQVAFSEVRIGGGIDPALLETRYDAGGWRHISSGETVDLAAAGWHVAPPAGFEPIRQVRRALKRDHNVHQMVLSDGLAAISVFIEAWQPTRAEATGITEHGATSIYRHRHENFWLTVLGEVPVRTVRQVAEAVRFEPSAR